MSTDHPLSVIVLAGGRSRRLGRDKALLPWRGSTLIEYMCARLREMSDDVLVVTGAERRYGDLLDVPIFADELRDCGPMGGLYTGLRHARHPYSLAVACDMPFVDRAVVDLFKSTLTPSPSLAPHPLLPSPSQGRGIGGEGEGTGGEGALAVVPEIEHCRVPTLAVYHKDCLCVIEKLHAQGQFSLQALLDSVPLKIISEEKLRAVDPTLRSFVNINTQADWESCLSFGAVLSSEGEI